ncbi:MAG: F0F1 ATP synthase subunit A [Anaerolineales bacterium]
MRGLIYLILAIAFTAIGCVAIPFFLMPDLGIATALPVIYVPGEPLDTFNFLPFTVTNTMLTTWIAIIITWALILPVTASLKRVPGRGQMLLELIVNYWYGLAKQVAGPKGRQLMPLILSIFFLVLVANLMKIFPGVDSVGELHCAGLSTSEPSSPDNFVQFSGYPVRHLAEIGLPIYRLHNDEAVNAGETISYEQYTDCKDTLHEIHDADFTLEEREQFEEEYQGGENGDEATLLLTAAEDAGEGDGSSAATEAHRYYETNTADDRYVVTPYIRGATTDLSLTFAIAIIAMLSVQYFGIRELGVGGWGVKFLNLPALSHVGQRPIGVIDFAVGLLEIVLEFMKVVSFAFRLFGAMFAGQILMFVSLFLVATFLPIAVIILEIFIGAIQAFVFAILFLMFSVVGMTPHHHDDDHHDDHHNTH